MTLSGFSEKYGIPLSIVHQASFNTPARRESDGYGYIEYPEDELFTAVRLNLEDKIKAAQANVEKNRVRLAKLHTRNGEICSIEEMCDRFKNDGL